MLWLHTLHSAVNICEGRSDMSEISDGQIYEAIGTAVVASQQFEKIFVFAASFAIKQSTVATLEDVVPVNGTKALKQPVMSVLKELTGSAELDGLEARIVALTQNRHIVVHRISGQWPGNTSFEERFRIRELCLSVTSESLDLQTIFAHMMGDWSMRFPQLREKIEALNLSEMYRHPASPPA